MILLLIYLFTIFSGGDSIDVFVSTDLEQDCNHMHVNGCITDEGIIVVNPFYFEEKGCTLLEHEIYHWLGYAEDEIPYCEINQWEMVHGSQ